MKRALWFCDAPACSLLRAASPGFTTAQPAQTQVLWQMTVKSLVPSLILSSHATPPSVPLQPFRGATKTFPHECGVPQQ